jgi:hypothetical protein
MCVSYGVEQYLHIIKQSYPHNRPWKAIGVSPVTYDHHHLYIKEIKLSRNRLWRPIGS